MTYVHRGDPANVDFNIGVLTANSLFHDLDLSAIIPADAKLVVLSVLVTENAGVHLFAFRKKGLVNTKNMNTNYSQFANFPYACNPLVVPDWNGIIEYYIQTGVWATFDITVRGWFR